MAEDDIVDRIRKCNGDPKYWQKRINHLADEAADEIESLKAAVAELLDALEFAEGAMIDAISLEDGLDGATGYGVLQQIWPLLESHGRDLTATAELRDWLGAQYAARPQGTGLLAVQRIEELEAEVEQLQAWRNLAFELWHVATPDPEDDVAHDALIRFLAAVGDQLEREREEQTVEAAGGGGWTVSVELKTRTGRIPLHVTSPGQEPG